MSTRRSIAANKTWQCNQCTYTNTLTTRKCEMCLANRFASVERTRRVKKISSSTLMVQSSDGIRSSSSKPSFEFGGPIGAMGIVICLPLVIYLLFFLCNDTHCLRNPFDWHHIIFTFESMTEQLTNTSFFTLRGCMIYISWMAINVLLNYLLPGEVVEGVLLRNNTRLKYKLTGHLQFWILLLATTASMWPELEYNRDTDVAKVVSLSSLSIQIIYEEFIPLASAAILFSFILASYLYISSFVPERLLSEGGNTGVAIYDFFIGRELNPRIGTLDLKEFCELRPGLIGWMDNNQHRYGTYTVF